MNKIILTVLIFGFLSACSFFLNGSEANKTKKTAEYLEMAKACFPKNQNYGIRQKLIEALSNATKESVLSADSLKDVILSIVVESSYNDQKLILSVNVDFRLDDCERFGVYEIVE